MKNIGLILGLVNTVAIAAVLGLFVYTKIMYKHPVITEEMERARRVKSEKKLDPHLNAKKALIQLDPIMVNLDPFKENGKEKIHYATLTLAVEIRDEAEAGKFSAAKPVVMDKIIENLGKKKFEDLNQVQGRYLFRSQIIDAANAHLGAPVVTEVYFSDFLLQ